MVIAHPDRPGPEATSGLRVLLVGTPTACVPATESTLLDGGALVQSCAEPLSAMEAATSIRSAADRLGGLDAVVRWTPIPVRRHVIHDAGAFAADIDRMLGGAHRVAIAAAEAMVERSGGSIVLVGPIDATHAYPGRSSIAAAMPGILGLARALAVELAGEGIRVNTVLTGPVGDDEGRPTPGDLPAERTLQRSPRPRLVTPTEVAEAISFVAGRSSSFMTGQSLRVDAGWASLNQAPDGMEFP